MAIAFNASVLTTGPATGTGEAPDAACPSCRHPMADHDPIGRRYCLASATSGTARGCICAGSTH